MTEIEEAQLVSVAAQRLSEHFDTVHIFVTRHDPGTIGGTASFDDGTGNWYARYGQIREWLIEQDEEARIKGSRTENRS